MALDLNFPSDGRYFSQLVRGLSGVSREEFLAACSDPFLLQFPFTRSPLAEPPGLEKATTRKTTRLDPASGDPADGDATMALSLESVLAAAKGRKQAEGAKIHRLTFGDTHLLVGRSFKCDAVLPESTVSNRHAELHKQDDGWAIKDLGSHNGTYIDGRRIAPDRLLEITPDQSLWFASYRTIFISAKKAYDLVAKYGQVAGA